MALARLRQRLLGRDTGTPTLGRYVLGPRLGAGGMAEVYRARDPQLDRDVAIKLVRGPTDGGRLAREARALARLSHPNVVSIFDVGVAGSGELFIAMELVEGQTLGERLRGADMGWREALPWLIAAGRGLAAAHRVGLVHRDFKPDNVIVGDDGRVRVADFGLSRAPNATSTELPTRPSDLPDDVRTLTHGRSIVGTPRYMAPEQHAGAAIDARTDVFSFCVVLYEVTYRQRPFASSSWEGLAAQKCLGPAVPPAADVPRWLARVIACGLRPDAAERWPTMEALLAALGDRSARAPRRLGRLAAVAGLVAVCASPAWATGTTSPVGIESGLAGLASRTRLVVGVAAQRDGDYADAAAQFERAFHGATEVADDRGSRRAAAHLALVSLQGLRQRDVAERWVRHAIAEDASARHGEGVDPLALRAQGQLAVARGDTTVARGIFDAEVRRAELHGDAIAIATALCDVADAQHHAGEFEDAAGSRRRALAQLRDAGEGADGLRARAWTGLGRSLTQLARVDEAKAALGRALVLRRRTLRADHPEIGSTLLDLGGAQVDAGELARGEASMRQALAIYESSLGPSHPQLAMAHAAIGYAASAARHHDDARMHHERAAAVFAAAWGPDHVTVGGAWLNVGIVLYQQGDDARAFAAFERGLDVLERAVGPRHPYVATAIHNLGQTAGRLNRPLEALGYLARAASIRTDVLGPDHPDVAETRAAQAAALRDLGLTEAAVVEFEAAVAALEHAPGSADSLAHARYGLALALTDAGRDRPRAMALAEASLALHRSRGGHGDADALELAAWIDAQRRSARRRR